MLRARSGILHLFSGSHLDNFPLKTLNLDRVAFHSVTFQLKCLDLQSNQYKKLVPVLSHLSNRLSINILTSKNMEDMYIRHSGFQMMFKKLVFNKLVYFLVKPS